MSRREFDFRYTCGNIDEALNDLDKFIEEELKDFADTVVNNYENPDEIYTADLEIFKDRIYDICSEACEAVREENKDIRDAAEQQIRGLNDTIEDLEDEKRDVEFDRDNLETTVDILQDEKAELEDIIADLKEELKQFENEYN